MASGELYPRVGFIVTYMARPAERVVAFYNRPNDQVPALHGTAIRGLRLPGQLSRARLVATRPKDG
jgi:hypothetical protein